MAPGRPLKCSWKSFRGLLDGSRKAPERILKSSFILSECSWIESVRLLDGSWKVFEKLLVEWAYGRLLKGFLMAPIGLLRGF